MYIFVLFKYLQLYIPVLFLDQSWKSNFELYDNFTITELNKKRPKYERARTHLF